MKLQKGVLGVAGVLAAPLVSPAASGQVLNESAKLLASDGAAGDWFGISVSVSGDVAVMGAYLNDDNGCNSGSAWAVVRNFRLKVAGRYRCRTENTKGMV